MKISRYEPKLGANKDLFYFIYNNNIRVPKIDLIQTSQKMSSLK